MVQVGTVRYLQRQFDEVLSNTEVFVNGIKNDVRETDYNIRFKDDWVPACVINAIHNVHTIYLHKTMTIK